MNFGGIEVMRNATHVTADGRKFHVTHGDEYDIVVRHARWLALLGDWAYETALFTNTHFNRLRRRLGLPYWSFSAWAKLKVKNAVNFIGAFEVALSEQAAKHGFAGVICGHIHHAVIRDINGITYVNIGDFVESCTVVAEHFDGTLEIVRWMTPGPLREPEAAELEMPASRVRLMRIVIATDAWHPQVNGVVRSIEAVSREAERLGATIHLLTPEGFSSVALPTYPNIRVALANPRVVAARIEAFAPDHVHIATEGPIGLAARFACRHRGRLFTTSYHTQFPDYLAARLPVPRAWAYAALRRFHNGGAGTMVATATLADNLRRRGFLRLMRWTRGVDHTLFRPRAETVLDLPRPIFLSVGRIAIEKNLEAFLSLDLPGSSVVVGDGPARPQLERRYPHVHFLGERTGEALAEVYASADVFVFPSRTDTFGIVLLEALACGLPIAAYPVSGPLDVIGNSRAGALDRDLGQACRRALTLTAQDAREHALRFSWEESARQFLDNIGEARRVSGCPDLRSERQTGRTQPAAYKGPVRAP